MMYSDSENRKPARVFIYTLGCPKNEVDGDVWMELLNSNGFSVVENPHSADVLIVNTCAFIEDARLESEEVIDKLMEIKRNYNKRLFITGCWSQKDGKILLTKYPDADGILGNRDLFLSFQKFSEFLETGEKGIYVSQNVSLNVPVNVIPKTFPYAYVKIAEGCSHRCTFCTIPTIRGRFRSVSMSAVVERVKYLVEHQFREIILVAQDTTNYGRDLPEKTNLPELLSKVAEIPGDFVIRVMYTYPTRVDRNLLETIRDIPKVVKYLDLPLQHYDDAVLRRMGREYNSDTIDRLLEEIFSVVPDIVLRSTFIVGFPGESDERFEKLLKFVERGDFLHIGVFAYSREIGTPAAALSEQVPPYIARLRKELIEMTHDEIKYHRNQKLVGKVLPVLVEKESLREDVMVGRLVHYDAPEVDRTVKIKGVATPGSIANARIIKALPHEFLGILEG